MDNVTHTLMGVVLGQSVPARSDKERRALLATAMIASNVPDLDLLLSRLGGGGKIGYLLQHRGYTHTLLAVPLLGLLLAFLLWRRQKQEVSLQRLSVAAMLGVLLHVTADYGNSYGVHPFYPVWNQWLYGAFMFIVEPLLWFVLLPFALLHLPWVWGRRIFALCGGAMLLLLLFSGWVDLRVTLLATFVGSSAGFLYARSRNKRGATMLPWLLIAAVYGTFAFTSRVARHTALAHIQGRMPNERVIDVALNPAPANPFCWETLLLSRRNDDVFVARRASVSLAPTIFSPLQCKLPQRSVEGAEGRMTAPVRRSLLSNSEAVQWDWEFQGAMAQLRSLLQSDCRVEALLRFVRMPYWLRVLSESGGWIVGDLRYDREIALSWAETDNREGGTCPRFMPPWYTPALSELRR